MKKVKYQEKRDIKNIMIFSNKKQKFLGFLLFVYNANRYYVLPPGIEPGLQDPQSCVLSVERQKLNLFKALTLNC